MHYIPARLNLLPHHLQLVVQARLSSTVPNSPYPFPTHSNPTPHQIFHLPHGATQADIKSRYYDLVRSHHPDSPICRAVPPDIRHARFQAITAAYDTLCGRGRHRARFDEAQHGHGYAEELERRRRQHQRRQEYHARYKHAAAADADAFNSGGDESWKDHIIIVVGVASLIVGFAPAFMGMSTIHDERHRSASANLAAARRDAREFGEERRRLIRQRVSELKQNQPKEKDDKDSSRG
ncbi:hypothetical protein BV25DRAFT_1831179 [Artomyces pyxidatus]|uniref:Uncharacterized protein n=1 Tax=Artomyces pyxidatus TaxID=48021 RepID=A0ACB8SNA2_9AGAM|nr:hypothetical protein BV25DRAFT_1831179 [Artomyces pyxidatus]